MSNRKQDLDRAIKESITPIQVAKQVTPKVTVSKTIIKHTFADAIGKAMAEDLRKKFA